MRGEIMKEHICESGGSPFPKVKLLKNYGISDGWILISGEEYIKINFCPFCGKKLE